MKKVEIISLLLVVAAIAGLLIAYFVENGLLTPWLFLLSLLSLIGAIDPTFSKQNRLRPQKNNRVGRAVTWLFIGMLGVGYVALLIAPFIPWLNVGIFYSLFIYGLSLVLLICWFQDFYPRRWMSRRLRWLEGKERLAISQTGAGKEKILFTWDKDGITYTYLPSVHLFFISREMFMNPARYEKEYDERKYQLQVRTEQTRISHAWSISDCESSLSFKVTIRMKKQDATKDNVCRLRDVVVDLAKDDFNQHLFSRLMLDDEMAFMETFHYQIIRMVLISADGNVECFNMREEPYQQSKHLSRIISMLRKERLDKLQPEDLIEKDEFERIWFNETSHCKLD